jgi:hypothetical protein
MAERPWHADIIMFDAAGDIETHWRYRWTAAAGGIWQREWPESMPCAEALAALAQLRRSSPRMGRCTVGTWPTPDGLHYPAPSWLLEAEYEPYGDTAAACFLDRVLAGIQRAWASWDFPHEVGVLTTDDYDGTMAMIDELLRVADAPQRVMA